MKRFLLLSVIFMCIAVYAFAQDQGVEKPFTYDYKGKRDPFWPLATEHGSIINYDERDLSASDMMLTGISSGADGNIAVINGKIVKEGDMVGAFKVEKIMSTFVVLDNGQEKSKLYLRKEE